MNLSLLLFGLGKVVFGVVVGVVGVYLSSLTLRKMMPTGDADNELRRGNLAVALVEAAGLLAVGLLLQHTASATFTAMDLMYRGHSLQGEMVLKFVGYGVGHAGISLLVGAGSVGMGAWLFGKLTRGIDEMDEVRKGNLGPALVLGAVMVVMSLVAAPGLQSLLDGLLPLPTLARDELVLPS